MDVFIPNIYIGFYHHVWCIHMLFICSTCSLSLHVYTCARQLIFLWKSDCLGCAVLLCLVVCLTLLASFFLPSFSSLINSNNSCMYIHVLVGNIDNTCMYIYCTWSDSGHVVYVQDIYMEATWTFVNEHELEFLFVCLFLCESQL